MHIFRKAVASTAIAGLTLVSTASLASAQPTELPPAIASIESQLTPEETERLQNLSPTEEQKFDTLGSLSGPSFIDQIARFFDSIGLDRIAYLIKQIFGASLGNPSGLERERQDLEDGLNNLVREEGVYSQELYQQIRAITSNFNELNFEPYANTEDYVATVEIDNPERECQVIRYENEELPRLQSEVEEVSEPVSIPGLALAYAVSGDDKFTYIGVCIDYSGLNNATEEVDDASDTFGLLNMPGTT